MKTAQSVVEVQLANFRRTGRKLIQTNALTNFATLAYKLSYNGISYATLVAEF